MRVRRPRERERERERERLTARRGAYVFSLLAARRRTRTRPLACVSTTHASALQSPFGHSLHSVRKLNRWLLLRSLSLSLSMETGEGCVGRGGKKRKSRTDRSVAGIDVAADVHAMPIKVSRLSFPPTRKLRRDGRKKKLQTIQGKIRSFTRHFLDPSRLPFAKTHYTVAVGQTLNCPKPAASLPSAPYVENSRSRGGTDDAYSFSYPEAFETFLVPFTYCFTFL